MTEAHPAAGRERVLTVYEFCSRFKVSRTTAYVLMRRGLLKTLKIGDRRLIPVEEVERLIARCSEGGAR